MLKKIKEIFTKNTIKNEDVIQDWVEKGKILPAPHQYKQSIIADYSKKYGYEVFVETGTYLGDMINAQKNNFKKLYTIELGQDLYNDAVKRFSSDDRITVLQGDSGKVLKSLMLKIDQPAIFWLDGHYSAGITARGEKECPIYEELSAIFGAKPNHHILLIDDARLFVGLNDYPTVDDLTVFIKKHRPLADIFVKDDTIHVIL